MSRHLPKVVVGAQRNIASSHGTPRRIGELWPVIPTRTKYITGDITKAP
jgi:hypothetical protein